MKTTDKIKITALFFLAVLASLVSCGTDNDDLQQTINKYTLTVNIVPAEGGMVNLQSGEYEENEELTATAQANDGWGFDGWTGGVTSSSSSLSFTISQNMTLTANFKQQSSSNSNYFDYDNQRYALEWGYIYDYGELTNGFRNFDFVLYEKEEDLDAWDEDNYEFNSNHTIYFWFESLGADSFDPGTYVFSGHEEIQENHLYIGELIFTNGSNDEDEWTWYEVDSGEVEISIEGDKYTLEFDLVLDNGKSLTGIISHEFDIFIDSDDDSVGKRIGSSSSIKSIPFRR